MNANVSIESLKTNLANAFSKFGTSARTDAINLVMTDAMELKITLESQPDYVKARELVESVDKSVLGCKSIIKDGMDAEGLKEFRAHGYRATVSESMSVDLSDLFESDPQAVIQAIKNGELDGLSFKKDMFSSKRLCELASAHSYPKSTSTRFYKLKG